MLSGSWELLLVILTVILSVRAVEECKIDTDKGLVDLNLLSKTFSVGSFANVYTYEVNVCGPATEFTEYENDCESTVPNAKGYRIQSTFMRTSCVPIANANVADVKLSLIDNDSSKGVKVEHSPFTHEGVKRSLSFEVICDPKADQDQIQSVSTTDEEYLFKVTSSKACPDPSSVKQRKPIGELGYGGLLMVLLVVVFVLYFIIGSIVCKFAFKKEGKEIIPNVDFWTSLPGLVVDGPMLFVDLIKKRRYTEVV
ncbi:M6PR [Acrasis kona]|uniref:Autophagy-related protein 27 n=1 Tax=Acrasis kona TaxID=1008807 RepID=A0AAW2ZME1_9EUKA